MAPPTGLEPVTPCINTTALRFAPVSWASLPCGQNDRIPQAEPANIAVSRPAGCYLISIGYHRSNAEEEAKSKRTAATVRLLLAPPTGLEPVTP